MKKNSVLPYDGETILIHDNSADFDWAALTRMLIGTIPWQVETAQLFGRELVVPRLTPWFGDAAYSYSGILHRPAPLPEIVERLRERAEVLSGASAARAVRTISQAGLYPSNCRILNPAEAYNTGAGDGLVAIMVLAFESANHDVRDRSSSGSDAAASDRSCRSS
jgi:hypothetical protein